MKIKDLIVAGKQGSRKVQIIDKRLEVCRRRADSVVKIRQNKVQSQRQNNGQENQKNKLEHGL